MVSDGINATYIYPFKNKRNYHLTFVTNRRSNQGYRQKNPTTMTPEQKEQTKKQIEEILNRATSIVNEQRDFSRYSKARA